MGGKRVNENETKERVDAEKKRNKNKQMMEKKLLKRSKKR